MFLRVFAVAALLSLAQPALGGETRSAEPGQVLAQASLSDLAWLEGRWLGPGIEDLPAQEAWLPPTGGVMVGTFIQQDPDGGVMFTEHMYLMREGDGLVLRLKHFGPELEGWEDKGESMSFPLLAVEGTTAYFDGMTYRREGDTLHVFVRMEEEGEPAGELAFHFSRAG
ncbi:DUF6265 family protein [Erythrobacter sp. LQ02-29]|uniref:DUF6265 family protein n=1 Tax=Erythrobacter sp. LQ02-29 TaxID=2920384 RepID=UPI001F4E717C|nr:DUF6265 family protein [Erythrobacter sp. LQ02-29]MCP9221775.1 DUF6265 family protein [Erythrobacter sp. LQ02-29]